MNAPVDRAAIAKRLDAIRAALPAGVTLIAVSKGHSEAAIRAAYDAGQRDFGESYAQEMGRKAEALAPHCPAIRWHFIGRVQTSNAKAIVRASLVHGVGSRVQAEALARRVPDGRPPLPVLLQVNLDEEASKNGFTEGEIRRDLPDIMKLAPLEVRGLMAVPAPDADPSRAFATVRALRDALRARLGAPDALSTLSMGMSDDYRAAIAQGATHVRIGTAIFGERPIRAKPGPAQEDA